MTTKITLILYWQSLKPWILKIEHYYFKKTFTDKQIHYSENNIKACTEKKNFVAQVVVNFVQIAQVLASNNDFNFFPKMCYSFLVQHPEKNTGNMPQCWITPSNINNINIYRITIGLKPVHENRVRWMFLPTLDQKIVTNRSLIVIKFWAVYTIIRLAITCLIKKNNRRLVMASRNIV